MKLIKCFLIILLLITISQNLSSQNYNRPVPPNLVYAYEFVQYDTTDYGYYLTAPLSLLPNKEKWLKPCMAILDKDGYLTWFSTGNILRFFNFQYHPSINKFSCYFQNNPHGFHFIDTSFHIVDTYSQYGGLFVNPHEFQLLQNGNVAFTLYKDSIMDLSAYTFGGVQGSPTTKVIGDVLVEMDTAKNIIFEWSTFDHIYPTETYDVYGYYENGYDYTHPNSIEEDTDGNFLVSFRHLDAVYKINRTTGDVIWRLGGKSNSFTFTNDSGFTAQHDFRSYPDGSYSVFDNAFPTPNECRATIYTLDTVAMTATKIWEHKPNPGFPALLMGNHQITDDLNHLINYGTSRRPYPSIDFTDNAGNLITRIYYQDSVLTYRCYVTKLPFEFPRPAIACTLATNALKLIAPPGFQSYLWSTGETTQEITVSDTGGVFQVWVNYGFGMLGSHPFFVNDSNNCAPMSINEYNSLKPEGPYEIFDLLGRKILYPKNRQLYIYRYRNGFTKLIYYSY